MPGGFSIALLVLVAMIGVAKEELSTILVINALLADVTEDVLILVFISMSAGSNKELVVLSGVVVIVLVLKGTAEEVLEVAVSITIAKSLDTDV